MPRHVAGVGVGMVRQRRGNKRAAAGQGQNVEGGDSHILLLDPNGLEESYGAMTLHVAGTRYGFNVCRCSGPTIPLSIPFYVDASLTR